MRLLPCSVARVCRRDGERLQTLPEAHLIGEQNAAAASQCEQHALLLVAHQCLPQRPWNAPSEGRALLLGGQIALRRLVHDGMRAGRERRGRQELAQHLRPLSLILTHASAQRQLPPIVTRANDWNCLAVHELSLARGCHSI